MLLNLSKVKFQNKNKWVSLIIQLTIILSILGLVYRYAPSNADSRQENQLADSIPKIMRPALKDVEWMADTVIHELDTEMKIPSYLLGSSQKPVKPPFDPRLTLAFYYDYILNNFNHIKSLELPFHWGDWVDMTDLDEFIYLKDNLNTTCASFDQRPYQAEIFPFSDQNNRQGAKDPETYCRKVDREVNGLGFEINSFPGRMTEKLASVAGKAYLYTHAPNPVSMVFLTKNGSYHIPLSVEKESLLTSQMVPEFLNRNKNTKSINTLKKLKELRNTLKEETMSVIHSHEVHVAHENFIMDPAADLAVLEKKRARDNLSRRERMYADALKTSLEIENSPGKYFTEAQVFDTLMSDHYDWRFFSGFENFSERSANSISRLTRAWLSFARKQGLTTWIAHGTLLAWQMNGLNFPWDYDADVQMPIKDLQRLSLKFNQSLVIEDSEDGFGRYFVDCGTFITTRTYANGNNNIDARFIDVDTGLYIDITGLTVTDANPPHRYHEQTEELWFEDSQKDINDQLQLYNCRNTHFASHSELSPLKKTYFEGEIAYIPNQYKTLLLTEYDPKAFYAHHYGGAFFVPRLRLWLSISPIRFFLRHRKEWHKYYGPDRHRTRKEVRRIEIAGDLTTEEIHRIDNWGDADLADFLLNEEILFKYLHSKNVTLTHVAEMASLNKDELTEEILRDQPDFSPVRYEPFLYRMKEKKETFELRVASYIRKSKALKPSRWLIF